MNAIVGRLADLFVAAVEPRLAAMLDRQVDRIESRLRAAVAEIRDDAIEVAVPVKAAAAEVRDAVETFNDAAGLVRRLIGR